MAGKAMNGDCFDLLKEVEAELGNFPRTFKAVVCSMGGNAFIAQDVLGPILQECGWELVTINEWSNANVKWTRDGWMREMLKADICLCPQREGIQDGKSSIRAVIAMSLGLPVIASPIPSYQEVITNGQNGYLASIHRLDEWRQALIALKDPATRERIGKAAKESVKGYSQEAIAGEWVRLFRSLLVSPAQEKAPAPPPQVSSPDTVDLIVATYNNLPYIKLCLNSIWLNTDSPYRIIISDAGSGPETWEYLRAIQGPVILGQQGVRLNYSEAINAGVAAGTSKYFVVMNSDLIVSKGWLRAMVDKMDRVDRLAACGNLSNCNIDWTVPANSIVPIQSSAGTFTLHAGMKIHQVQPFLEPLQDFMKASNTQHKGVFHKREWVAGYCTIYARGAWEEVGGYDPVYQNGCEDWDHCHRLRKAGYEIGEAYDAFIFHFGGVSRGHYQNEGKEKYDAEDKGNHVIKGVKWQKKKIAIWTGPGYEKWDRHTVDAGMAGSETWAAELSAEFSRRGYHVFLFGDCREPHQDRDGVWYYPYNTMEDVLAYDWADVLISSRSVEPLKQKNLHVGQCFVMVHDVFINQDRKAILPVDWRVKKYAYLSDWHKSFLLDYHEGMRPEKMFLTCNGVNQGLYRPDLIQPDFTWNDVIKKNQTVYSSSHDRGLKELLLMLPEIRKAVPDFVVKVAYGFGNAEKMARMRGDQAMLQGIEEIKRLMNQPGVEYLGRIDKKTLAQHQMESKVWLMPGWFCETFCIGAVENGLARNAILSSNIAGLQTTVGAAGILLDGFGPYGGPHLHDYRSHFIELSIQLIQDEPLRQKWADRAYEKEKAYTWAAAADGWLKEFGWT